MYIIPAAYTRCYSNYHYSHSRLFCMIILTNHSRDSHIFSISQFCAFAYYLIY